LPAGKFGFCSAWTIIDRSGKEILPQTYEDLDYYDGADLIAAATTISGHEVWGYIDLSGKWIIPPQYDYAKAMQQDRGIVFKNMVWSLIDATGTIVVKNVGVIAAEDYGFSEGVALARESGPGHQFGYVDLNGTFVIPPQFDDAEEFREGLAPVSIAHLWGFISHDGKFAINPSFKWASSFRRGRAAVCTDDGQLRFVDRTGSLVKGGDTWIPCPEIGFQEQIEAAFSEGVFAYDYDRDLDPKQSPGWSIINTSRKPIYLERDTAGPPATRHDEPRVMTGTAFVVSDSGYLLTNAHVVDGCSKVELPSAKISAEVVNSDPNNDLALLHASSSLGNRYARIARPEDLTLGAEVVIFGFPLTGALASSGNFTTGVVSAVTGLGDDSRFFQLTAPVQPGNSGGPVLNEYGDVIGIASATLDQRKAVAATGNLTQNVNFAIGPSMIWQFLSANGVSASSPNSWWHFKQGTQKLAQSAGAFTYSVKCKPKETSEERKVE
jgi:S1-C subfamily serine protease